ncbi:MAG TPA: glucose 1-dehydrogenase [Candidatus Bathyarchaeia archaeon]|nr:glucose 1-dehydrogenase [Candidatus Bathyarchaeia archaeon]
MKLAAKVGIITGGAAGLGLAYARRFLEEGARILVADIVDPASALRELGAAGEVHAVRCDVASAAAVEAMVAEAVRRFGRVDILVNNAALFAGLHPTPFEQIEEAEWDRLMAVNVKGVWLCCRAVAPVMKAQRAGRIINIASAIVAKGTPLLMHYVASKGAVIAMTRVLARELGEHGIAVNALAPGLIMSDTARANADLTGFQAQQVIASRAFRREAVAADVVGAAVFLASEDSAFITGQTLVVDGGSVFL